MVARKHGLTVTDDEFRRTFGRPSRDIIRILWGRELDDSEIRRIDDEKEAAYRELITGIVPLTIGTRECLRALRSSGLRLAVATSGPPENVQLVLRETGLTALFDATVTGADVTKGKPAPDCFLLAAQRLSLPPASCVVVEDAPVGIEAACRAGIRCIGLVGTHPADALRAAGAAEVVDQLAEITLDRINNLTA
jgi:HAD superfamily hydrolase (TIGR01509 family)